MKGIKNLIITIDNFINKSFFKDYPNWILWTPIIFGFGIISYFGFKYENSIMLWSFLGLNLSILILIRKNKEISLIFLAFLIFLSGYIRAFNYTKKLSAPSVKYKMGYVKIHGIIDDLSYYQKDNEEKKRIVVRVLDIEKNKKPEKNDRERNSLTPYFTIDGVLHNHPKYLRVNINNKTYKPKFGDEVRIRANLIPVMKKSFPGSYDMERMFYFQQIGGIAYNGYIYEYSTPKNQSISNRIKNATYNTRENINNRIISALNEKTGPVIGSFITGIRGKIDTEEKDNMTYAGLAHLIAISGLHMVIIMGFAFSIFRRVLSQSEYLTLRFNIKKASAIFAIIVGFLYLSITGFPVSANRAYIMSILFFFGIILEREVDTMRFLCLAGIMILFQKPNLILEPSFQLSFLSVTGLVAGFKYLKEHNISTYTSNKWLKPFYHLFAIFVSSIITEISVTPIAIYHFNNYTPYNMITNMVAIPLVGFIILPLSALSILLFPFHLERYLLIPSSWAMEIILKIAKYVVDLPSGVHIVSSPSILGLTLILLGFLWFALWEQKWRYFGIPLFIFGVIFSIFKTKPNLIIDKKDKFIVIVEKNGDLYFSDIKNRYKIETIIKKFGEKDYKRLEEYCNKFEKNENCIKFNENIDYIFRNEDTLENFIKLNNKYEIFDTNFRILLN